MIYSVKIEWFSKLFCVCLDPVVEYLSVYVYTCERSCWTDGDTVRQEFVIVDLEDDTSLVNKALSSMSAVDCTKLAAEAMESTTAVLE